MQCFEYERGDAFLSSGTVLLSHFCFRKELASVAFACIVFQHLIHSYWESSFLFKCRNASRNFQIHANLPVSVPAPTSDRVCPPLARSALRVVAYFPGKDRYSFPLWLFSCRCDSPYEAGRRPGVSVFLAVARSAVPICRPGHQYRGQNKSRFRLEAAHFVQKTKCADFNMKSAAVGRFFAHCNRKSLAAANTQSRFFRE